MQRGESEKKTVKFNKQAPKFQAEAIDGEWWAGECAFKCLLEFKDAIKGQRQGVDTEAVLKQSFSSSSCIARKFRRLQLLRAFCKVQVHVPQCFVPALAWGQHLQRKKMSLTNSPSREEKTRPRKQLLGPKSTETSSEVAWKQIVHHNDSRESLSVPAELIISLTNQRVNLCLSPLKPRLALWRGTITRVNGNRWISDKQQHFISLSLSPDLYFYEAQLCATKHFESC